MSEGPPPAGAGSVDIDDLFSATYEQLRRLAASVKRSDRCATLNPTALVHEAYARLAAGRGVSPGSHQHFKRIAARAWLRAGLRRSG